jgi:hypothetical protein
LKKRGKYKTIQIPVSSILEFEQEKVSQQFSIKQRFPKWHTILSQKGQYERRFESAGLSS